MTDYIDYYEDGQVATRCQMFAEKPHGRFFSYYENGFTKANFLFKEGKFK